MWLLANANQGGLVFQAIKDAAAQLSPIILKLAIEGRRVPFEGGVAYVGPTYEERLSLIVSMAQSLSRSAITKIVGAVFERLKGELETESIAIVDAVDLLRSLESATNVPDAQKMIAIVRKKLLAEAADGCRVDELREVISVINTTDPSSEEVAAARVAFSMYSALHFNDDLRECRSGEQFDSLIEDLQLFREELGADVDGMIERVEEAKSEYEEHQEAYADHMQDEWKERSRDERAGDRAVSDMFGSLKNDRN
jgi:hypothetical protein